VHDECDGGGLVCHGVAGGGGGESLIGWFREMDTML
jgi:hypothetical protein